MAALASDWLRHFRLLLWKRWTEFNEKDRFIDKRPTIVNMITSFWNEEHADNNDDVEYLPPVNKRPKGPRIVHLSTMCQLTGSKISTSSTKFVFFGPIGKTRWPPWPLIGWDIFDFFSETPERNSTKLDRKQDLNVFYQVCVFQADE